MFSPTKDTFIKAINNNSFLTWPGLTLKLISKHLLPSIATHSGLLRQEKQGLHSIKSLAMTATAANISQATDDFFPKFDPKDPRCMLRHVSNHRLDAFHINPAGNEYILIGYHFDSNAIYGVPLKNRQAATITKAWKQLHNKFQVAGAAPNT